MNFIKSWKSQRKRNAIMRKFKNVCWILHEADMSLQDRHNIFCECVTQANLETSKVRMDLKDKKVWNLRAQEIFIARMINENFKLFKGKKI